MQPLLLADYALFLGRFHPLLVHLPIGFLLLAVLLEFWPGDRVRPAIRVAWALGALTAVAAAGFGWLLASGGGYGGQVLFLHRWAGVAVAVLAVAGTYLTRNGGKYARAYGLLTAGALVLAGHQGGNLTHGEEYLVRHAPAFVQRIAGYAAKGPVTTDWSQASTDSIELYASFIEPVLNDKCVSCHNADKQNGGLRLDAPHRIFAGGEGGPIVVAGQPLGSEWMRRVTLPHGHAKAMPPRGTPLSYTEIGLLEYWIAAGADTSAVIDPEAVPEALKTLLRRDFDLDLSPKLFAEKIRGPVLAADKREDLTALNWTLNDLVPGGPALEAAVAPGRQVTAGALRELAAAAPQQVTALNLDRQSLNDEDLAVLAAFPNLNRLRLNGTGVGSATVRTLKGLRHLESLNLYDTRVTDTIFEHLDGYPALRRLYLWRTDVSAAAAAAFAADHPGIEVDTGFRFSGEQNTTK